MPKPSARRLVSNLTGVPTGRRAAYSASTRRALIQTAEEMFTERGYANTSLDSVAAGAEVTKGALYHHFGGKAALFESVLKQIEADAAVVIDDAVSGVEDPWDKAEAGLAAFMDVVQEPRYRRIVIQEGPAVLGYERFREQEERSTYAIVLRLVRAVLGAGTWELSEEMLHTFARIFFGTMSAAGGIVAGADEPQDAAERVQVAVQFMLQGIRSLVESDSDAPYDVLPGVNEITD